MDDATAAASKRGGGKDNTAAASGGGDLLDLLDLDSGPSHSNNLLAGPATTAAPARSGKYSTAAANQVNHHVTRAMQRGDEVTAAVATAALFLTNCSHTW